MITKLKYTTINPLLDLHYVDIMAIKLNIAEAAKIAESKAKTKAETDRYAKICGWSEILTYPNRYIEFLRVFGEMILTQSHSNKTNLPFQLESKGINYWNNPKVHWFWFSPLIKMKGLQTIKGIWKTISPDTEFYVASSDETNNARVEAEVNDLIFANPNKQIVILSIGMGSRSCSIAKLYYTHLCFDGGSEGATTQKQMRMSSTDPNNLNKIGVIISHSFNPNMDDKFDSMLLEVNKINNKAGIQQTIEFAKDVFPIYVAGDRGLVYEDYTEFIKGAINRGSVSKVAVSRIDISNIPKDYIQRISKGIIGSNVKLELLKTTISSKKIKGNQSISKTKKDNTEDKFREVCKYVYDHSHYIIGAGRSYGVDSILESFNCIENDKQFNILKKDIENAYGIKYQDLKKLFVDKIIDTDWCDMNSVVKLNKKLC
jgi:hypothetical protein